MEFSVEELSKKQEKLKKYLQAISENLSSCIMSLNLFKTISFISEDIQKSSFGYSLFAIQRLAINDIILSLSKIFEETKESINLKKIERYICAEQRQLALLNDSISSLEKYTLFDFSTLENYHKEIDTKRNGFPYKIEYEAFELLPFLTCLQKGVKKIYLEYEHDIQALKDIRDRTIAHSDKRPIVKKTTWDKVDILIQFLEHYVDMMDSIFFNTCCSGDGCVPYSSIRSDATKPSSNLLRLLEKASVINGKNKEDTIRKLSTSI